jgi:hypothetical protein
MLDEKQVREVVEHAKSDPSTGRREALLTLEGSGVGIAGAFGLTGALSVLEEDGWAPIEQTGAGIGALIVVLRACGYSAINIAQLLDTTDFSALLARRPTIARVLARVRRRRDNVFEEWVSALTAGRGIRSLRTYPGRIM